MLSDGAKVVLATKVLRRRYTGDKLTSGELITGKVYRMDRFFVGDDFSNVGSDNSSDPDNNQFGLNRPAGETHRIFIATGTTPTGWTNGSILRELKVDDLKALQEITFATASKTVTVKSAGFEGGSGSGDITFEKAILSLAIENLIEEFDPDYDVGPIESDGIVLEFGP